MSDVFTITQVHTHRYEIGQSNIRTEGPRARHDLLPEFSPRALRSLVIPISQMTNRHIGAMGCAGTAQVEVDSNPGGLVRPPTPTTESLFTPGDAGASHTCTWAWEAGGPQGGLRSLGADLLAAPPAA